MAEMMNPNIEIYPMPSFPRLVVRDLEASLRWYCDGLGFLHVFTMPGPGGNPSLLHLRWIKYADLLLVPDPQPGLAQKGAGVMLNYMAEDIDALTERARSFGAQIVEGPVNRPWNTREVVIQDPDGYRLVFFARVEEGLRRSFDEIVASAARGKD